MNQLCGCCSGIEVITPESEVNRPGLTAIAYRVGTYATFLESMLARLSNLFLDVSSVDDPGKSQRIYPLQQLTTRELSDPSIALLDAWATVADVLTFYQERIANEGYLDTATERLSVLELARLVGYKLRPGVSASVFLSFTVTDGFDGIIPAGTRAQSIPGSGEKPQFFETSVELAARGAWNNLGVRLTRPQVITLASTPSTDLARPAATATIDQGTDAATRDTLYFKGIATNLKVGDVLLIVSGDGPAQQVLRYVQSVSPQSDQNRTEVTLQEPALSLKDVTTAKAAVQKALGPFVDDAANIFEGSDIATQTAGILTGLIEQAQSARSLTEAAAMVQGVIPQIQERHDIAVRRKFTRLEPWIAGILNTLHSLAEQLWDRGRKTLLPNGITVPMRGVVESAPAGLKNLVGILGQLALPPNPQPANSLRLARNVAQTFAPQSDIAPRLLAAFKPAAATTLYQAWGAIATAPSPVRVYAMRAKAAAFGNNATPFEVKIQGGKLLDQTPWVLSQTDSGNPKEFWLDSVNDKITPGDWVVVFRTDPNASSQPLITRVTSVNTVSRADYGMSARVTQLTIDQEWFDSSKLEKITIAAAVEPTKPETGIGILRGAGFYVQPEELELAEEPLDRDMGGNTIELDGLYDGLESGRWIIVSGQRTDIADATGGTVATGVTGNELVMIAAVNQGPGKQSCMAITLSAVPFSDVYYVTGANDAGDRLVVGRPNPDILRLIESVPLPNAAGGNQQVCDPVELAPGLYANVYIPTSAERLGNFTPFADMLIDPATGNPFPGGIIPLSRAGGSGPTNAASVWAWRITTIASGQDTPHTSLVLANSLAYRYDSATVTISGNVVKATNGQTVGEVLGSGDGSQTLQKFTLGQSPLTYVSAATPAGAESTLTVRVNEIEWRQTDNLAGLGPRDRDYVAETDDAGKTSVIFGTGVHGARLPTGNSNVKATYRYGIGKGGNVAAQQISQLATQPLGAKGVINRFAASGGADADTRDQARGNAPLAVEALDRLVSVEDYASFARTFAGIGKASSARLSDGRRLIVHVTIAGVDDIPIDPSSDLFQNLLLALQRSGDPYLPIQLAVRKLKLLVISAGVKVLPDYTWESVEPRVRAAMLDKFGFDRRDLGRSAFLGEAISAIQNVEGVSYVNMTRFDSVAEDITAAELAGMGASLRRRNLVQADLAQVDQAQTDPIRRILPAELAVLAPEIPDMLILTQMSK